MPAAFKPVLHLLSMSLLASVALSAPAQTTVEQFSPSGTVKTVRQVTARFSTQMVPFGDLRLADPFAIDCAEPGVGRWIDGRNWSYDFTRDLPAGVRCSFTLRPELKDLAAQPVGGTRQFGFDTGGPSVVSMSPREGSQVDEQQIFVLGLDSPAREETILAKAYCVAGGINERIGVRLVTGAEREQVLGLRKAFVRNHLKEYAAAPSAKAGAKAAPLALVQCKRTLPPGTSLSVVWGAGIASPTGIATAADQKLAFNTREDFRATFSCDRLKANGECIPFLPMRLGFSAPLARAQALAVTLKGADGKVYKPTLDKEQDKAEHVYYLVFKGPFPEKAALTLQLPAKVKDDAGRPLSNQAMFPLTVRTDEQPPLVKFPARFGIVEAKGERMLPVTVRNVEPSLAARMRTSGSMLLVGKNDPKDASKSRDKAVIDWIQRVSGYGTFNMGELSGEEIAKSLLKGPKAAPVEQFALPAPGGGRDFEVIGIPLPKPGFYIVELESPRLGAALMDKAGAKAYISSAALVTDMAAHFKRGAESSLVWVTSLDRGRPVPKAKVAVRTCAGELLWQGETNADGVARIDTELKAAHCKGTSDLFISARSGEDYTFTLSSWQNGIEQWRFNLPDSSIGADNTVVSTVFDRSLLRAGETVHMKHFMRRSTARGIALAKPDIVALAQTVTLTHQGSDDKFELPLKWHANGTAENEWAIPAAAKLGVYDVMIGHFQAGKFRVEQFRVPSMKAVLSGPKTPAIAAAALDVDVQVSYLSGGAAGNAPVKLRSMLQDRSVRFDGYEEFSFAAGDVRTGVEKNEGSMEDEFEEDGMEGEESAGPAGTGVRTRALVLDKAGGARVRVDQLPRADRPQNLVAEVSYQDANGETLSTSTRIALWPSNYVIGIKPDDWALSRESLKFQVVVLDVGGKPVRGARVAVDFYQRLSYSHRRRLLGGFYSYENSSEIKKLGAACEGETDARGLLLCQVKAPADGNLILRARTEDGEQRAAVTRSDVWVAGSDDWWFTNSDNDRIDLLPGKKRYEPGEQATFQVRSPFREATALISVEREGIVDTYVRRLNGKNPTFTIPVKGSYAPNVFVSALVVRGRVAGVKPTALVDLGKPAFKLGIVPMRVGWSAHELKVSVKADKPVYKVRDKASVAIKVTRADGSAPPAGAEVALAAVDAGLLQLMPNTSWELLDAMMQERGLQVETSTAQMQVIGKRHFGRKAFPAGGGGGKGTRELFETLLLWKARVALDAAGEARVQVPMNDSLTSFRIVAIANAGTDLFGTGSTEIQSSQDLIVLPGLPSLVREGDKLRAGFTLRNTTAAPMTVDFGASAGGQALPRQSIALAPGEAKEAGWDYVVPAGIGKLAWEADAKTGESSDKLRVNQTVLAAVPVRTIQATLVQVDKPFSMEVKAPADAIAGRGGVRTSFSARLGGDLPGVREFMLQYPYRCFEQNTSRAVALRDPAMWKANMAVLPAHLDSDGMVKYFVTQPQGEDTLTAYVLSVGAEAGYAIPDALRKRMQDGLLAFVRGKLVRRSALPTADLAVRKMAALEAYSRELAVPADAFESFSVEPNLWPTSAVIDWYLVLQRSPALEGREAKLAQAQQILRSRLNLQGTTMGFSTERTDNWWWLMVSIDRNANRLLLAMLDNPAWQEDMGRLARGAIGRQKKGRWDTTLANAWGMLAIEKFSRKFESEPVTGSSSVKLGSTTKESGWSAKGATAIVHPWPKGSETLTAAHNGGGKPWAVIQSQAAIPLKAPLSSGYRIVKTITPVEQARKGVWSRGDTYRVRLDLEAQADMTWVVVDDPIPASASLLGTGLGGGSEILATGERRSGGAWPVYEERAFDAFRAYYDYVPKGSWRIEYTVRLNNQGKFSLPPTHVEAMYSPEMFGDAPNAPVEVGR